MIDNLPLPGMPPPPPADPVPEPDPRAFEPEKTASGNPSYAARARNRIRVGMHPLGHTILHPAAPHDPADRTTGPRCGGCVHRDPAGYPKCRLVGGGSEATDCRAWWPACRFHEPTPPITAPAGEEA